MLNTIFSHSGSAPRLHLRPKANSHSLRPNLLYTFDGALSGQLGDTVWVSKES